MNIESFKWTEISFAGQAERKIIILVCSDKENAENFLNTLKSIEFNFKVIIKKPLRTFSFEIQFQTGEVIGFDSIFTEKKYPPVKWAKLQQLTHLTTAYRDEKHKLQLLSPFHPFENNLHLN